MAGFRKLGPLCRTVDGFDLGTLVRSQSAMPGVVCSLRTKIIITEAGARGTHTAPRENVHNTIKIQKIKSGSYWVEWADIHATFSKDVEMLEISFKNKVKLFLKALDDAGVAYKITTTKRSAKRAYLFHWSWQIVHGIWSKNKFLRKCKASEATKMPGVDIEWDHGNEKASKLAAQEMLDDFELAAPPKSTSAPALSSNHIKGEAIDLVFEVPWTNAKIKKQDGTEVLVPYLRDVNVNTLLHEVGKSYGLIKHLHDAPHWSINGK